MQNNGLFIYFARKLHLGFIIMPSYKSCTRRSILGSGRNDRSAYRPHPQSDPGSSSNFAIRAELLQRRPRHISLPPRLDVRVGVEELMPSNNSCTTRVFVKKLDLIQKIEVEVNSMERSSEKLG